MVSWSHSCGLVVSLLCSCGPMVSFLCTCGLTFADMCTCGLALVDFWSHGLTLVDLSSHRYLFYSNMFETVYSRTMSRDNENMIIRLQDNIFIPPLSP